MITYTPYAVVPKAKTTRPVRSVPIRGPEERVGSGCEPEANDRELAWRVAGRGRLYRGGGSLFGGSTWCGMKLLERRGAFIIAMSVSTEQK